MHIVYRDRKKVFPMILLFVCFLFGHGSGKRISILVKVYLFMYCWKKYKTTFQSIAILYSMLPIIKWRHSYKWVNRFLCHSVTRPIFPLIPWVYPFIHYPLWAFQNRTSSMYCTRIFYVAWCEVDPKGSRGSPEGAHGSPCDSHCLSPSRPLSCSVSIVLQAHTEAHITCQVWLGRFLAVEGLANHESQLHHKNVKRS